MPYSNAHYYKTTKISPPPSMKMPLCHTSRESIRGKHVLNNLGFGLRSYGSACRAQTDGHAETQTDAA